jgi:predicted deacylase
LDKYLDINSVGNGEIKEGYLEISGTKVQLPLIVINGNKPGKTVLLTGGIHGCEYTGIVSLLELAKEICPAQMTGRLLIVPVANPTGFQEIVPYHVPEDGFNLNRRFPGHAEGSLSERLAYVITSELQARADFYIDLHAGDLYEQVTPYVYYPGIAEAEVTEVARKAAASLKVPYRVKSSATTGAYNSAAIQGVPSILIERGGGGRWSREEVDAYKADIHAVLNYLGVLTDTQGEENTQQLELDTVYYPEAGTEGFWYPCIKPGDKVKKGQLLGEIKDVFGNVLEVCEAEANAVVLYMTTTLSIKQGNPTVAYGII